MGILESLLAGLRTVSGSFPDARRGAIDYPMADVTMAAFSMFFMQSESFLGYQKRLERGQNDSNCRTLFGIAKIPTDNHIRTLLDRVAPDSLRPCFDQALETLAEQDGLRDFQRLGGRLLVALDGTEYFVSQKICCPRCLKRERSSGKTEYYHALLGATLVAPGHNRVLPLVPEFIAAQDGQVKQDCERNAAKRWLKDHGPHLARLRPIYLGDALFACQPLAEAVRATGADFLFVSKPESHKTLYEYLRGAEFQQHTVAERRPEGHSQTYGYRWTETMPLRDGKDALAVQWLEITITNSVGKTTYRNAFVTSLGITADNVAELAACARARWKVENENFNVLKNNGYNLAHNFGHGNSIWRPPLPRSICWPSPSTPSWTAWKPAGNRPAKPSARAKPSSPTSTASPATACFQTGRSYFLPWFPAKLPPLRIAGLTSSRSPVGTAAGF